MTHKSYLYRFVDSDVLYQVIPILEKFEIIKHTPCGYWIEYRFGHTKKFVRKNSVRSFAKDSIKGALDSYYARKNRQRQILTAQLEYLENILDEMKTQECRSELVEYYVKNDIEPDSTQITCTNYYPEWE